MLVNDLVRGERLKEQIRSSEFSYFRINNETFRDILQGEQDDVSREKGFGNANTSR